MTNPLIAMFDAVAADYDQSGVDFFQPIAELLVKALDPRPGERCLDVGCGRGAVTRRLVARTGAEVLGGDLSAEMVRLAARDIPGARFELGDAAAPGPADAAWDVVASSLVLFFLPDPVAALAAWRVRLRPGGRVGLTTFGSQHPVWREIDAVFAPYLPGSDQRARANRARFVDDANVDAMLTEAGFLDVVSKHVEVPVVFHDLDQWFAWSMATVQCVAWQAMTPAEHAANRARCEAVLAAVRREGGRYEVGQDVRVTTGRAPQ